MRRISRPGYFQNRHPAALISAAFNGKLAGEGRWQTIQRDRAPMKFGSPLRYPGGKTALAQFLARTIELNHLSGCAYYEPFAGGAGAALRLLHDDIVSEIHLNDLDHRVTAFWTAALDETERFAEAIRSVPVTIEECKKQREICQSADRGEEFELGFATFYLNRCNRSGIILGAAPIGGYAQTGKWGIDSRFYRETLANRILAIGNKREQIYVTNMDACAFLSKKLPKMREQDAAFVYLDPPYYSNGNRLYMNAYKSQDHEDLAQYIKKRDQFGWIMSYDDTDSIRELYQGCRLSYHPIDYILQKRRRERELIISPAHVELPQISDL